MVEESRKKHPEQVRDRLLEVARELTIAHGWGNFSLDAVAKGAGVSKGGLIHHFASKNALLDAVLCDLMDYFDRRIREAMDKDPNPTGRFVRAFVLLPLLADDSVYQKLSIAACMAAPNDTVVNAKWEEWMGRWMPPGKQTVQDMIIKYAADGLWISSFYNKGVPENLRKAIIDKLVELSKVEF